MENITTTNPHTIIVKLTLLEEVARAAIAIFLNALPTPRPGSRSPAELKKKWLIRAKKSRKPSNIIASTRGVPRLNVSEDHGNKEPSLM